MNIRPCRACSSACGDAERPAGPRCAPARRSAGSWRDRRRRRHRCPRNRRAQAVVVPAVPARLSAMLIAHSSSTSRSNGLRSGAGRRRQAEMAPARLAQHAAAAGAQDQALLDQEGLDHVFQRVARLGERGGQGLHPDRAAAVVLGDAAQVAAVHGVQAELVHLQPGQRGVGDGAVDRIVAVDGGEVAHPAQQPPGDARRAAAARAAISAAPSSVSAKPSLRAAARRSAAVRRACRTSAAAGCRSGRATGVASRPARVVAPTRVKGARSMRTLRAAGPSPMIRSSWKSSIAG